MSNKIQVETSEASSVQRFKFLPRIGVVVDFAGKKWTFRHAPTLETLWNLRQRGFTMKNFVEVAFQQLSEIKMKDQPRVVVAGQAKKSKARKPARK